MRLPEPRACTPARTCDRYGIPLSAMVRHPLPCRRIRTEKCEGVRPLASIPATFDLLLAIRARHGFVAPRCVCWTRSYALACSRYFCVIRCYLAAQDTIRDRVDDDSSECADRVAGCDATFELRRQ